MWELCTKESERLDNAPCSPQNKEMWALHIQRGSFIWSNQYNCSTMMKWPNAPETLQLLSKSLILNVLLKRSKNRILLKTLAAFFLLLVNWCETVEGEQISVWDVQAHRRRCEPGRLPQVVSRSKDVHGEDWLYVGIPALCVCVCFRVGNGCITSWSELPVGHEFIY